MKALLLTGPSGSGKTTLAHTLLQRYPELTFSISATTRPPRPGETHGKDYYFLAEAEFDRLLAQNAFLEWERLFSGHRYGTLRQELERIRDLNQVPLFVKDVKGTLALKNLLGPGAITVFLLPPSLETLRERLIQRGENAPADIEERLLGAKEEIRRIAEFDFVLYNDELPKAAARIERIIQRYLL
ncbi:MAG: guanylate kinase [Bacteroidia bacterium]|nr:guanylate kinase [Bacteroidia bacterium]